MTRFEPIEEVSGGGCELGVEGESLAVDLDGRGAGCAQGLDDLLDAGAGGVLKVAADGESGEDDGQVCLDRVLWWWNTGRVRRSLLVIRKDSSTRHRSW